ncbi:MAG TPA: UDP-N-acetylmuramoylalanyl-D-glutamyl-2,6-diaminopimelate--D-alanyl-D-alanine ligase [Stellaceae bacterium]|nr:UDP-N-acetylmuramoylalanyl-D-glutamyl-2,6-diaminopimelate--D-alanyl-D-alanine ligase [Stellaceae bacterium]
MTALWTASDLVAATGGTPSRDFAATGVSIDSRTITAGDLFIALQGPNFDGHAFVVDALAKGAAGALVAQVPAGLAADAPLLVVADTLEGLTALGHAARRRSHAKIVAVTGSVGKTGTKEALRLALASQGLTHASVGSFNNQWGVPLSLARMPREADFGVFELGMNHAGELAELSRLARPHVGLITTIEPAHLGFFASLEAIADAKAEIFDGIEPGGAAVLNRDNPFFARLAKAARRRGISRTIDFGEHAQAAIRLLDCRLGEAASAVTASVMGEVLDCTIALPGRHWVMNSLAVLGAVKAVGGDVGAAAATFAQLTGLPGRGRRHTIALQGGSFDLIDESYNASPAAVRAAIAVLGAADIALGGRRIAVLGDMRELGSESARLHAELVDPLVKAKIGLVYTVGDDMARLHAALPERMRGTHCATTAEMAPIIAAALLPGDVVTVKGSLSVRMAVIVKHLLAGAPAPTASCAAAR